MLGRAHRDQRLGRVDAQKVLADLFDFPQLAVDMGLAEQADVEPQVFSKT